MSGYEAKSSGISLTSLDWSLWSMVFECVLVAGYHLSQLGLKGVPYNLNTTPASEGCFYPNTYHRGYSIFCSSVLALIVLKYITSMLYNLWSFPALRTSQRIESERILYFLCICACFDCAEAHNKHAMQLVKISSCENKWDVKMGVFWCAGSF